MDTLTINHESHQTVGGFFWDENKKSCSECGGWIPQGTYKTYKIEQRKKHYINKKGYATKNTYTPSSSLAFISCKFLHIFS